MPMKNIMYNFIVKKKYLTIYEIGLGSEQFW